MAKFINPWGNKSADQGTSDLAAVAKEHGIQVPEQKPSFFQRLMDVLNYPSLKTEKFLTGGKGYSSVLKQAGIQETPGKIDANDLLAFGGRLLLDPLNLIAPLGIGGKALKGVETGAELAGKIKPIGTVGRALEDLFVPFAKLKKVSPELAEAIPALETATKAKQAQAVTSTAELAKQFSPDIQANLGKIVETTGQQAKNLTPQELEAATKTRMFIEKNITAPEKAAGILPETVADYFPRKTEREGVQNLLQFGGNRLSLSLGGAEKTRTFATQEAGELAKVAYKNPLEALAARTAKSEAAQANAGFIKKLVGGEVKDVSGNPLVAPITKGLAPGYQEFTIKGLKGFQAPQEAVKEIEKFYNAFTSDEATKTLLKGYDTALGVWKGSVTSLFPAFHLRNELGNLTNMWLGGFPLHNPLAVAQKLNEAKDIQLGKDVTVGGVKVGKDLLEQLGIISKGQFGYDIPGALGNALGKKTLLQKLNPLELGRKVGAGFENNARIAFFLDRVSKGDNFAQATAQVKKYLFDYSALTPFEKNVMRRVVPFYTWIRNNLPLQLENLITQPGKMAAFAKLENLSPLTEEQKAGLPPYLGETINVGLGKTPEGNLKVLSGTGLPFEDLSRLWRGSVSRTVEREGLGSTGPLGNILGFLTNRDFFRGKPTTELGYSYGYEAKNYPDWLKKFVKLREETTSSGKKIYYADPTRFQLIKLIAPRILSTISQPEKGIQVGKISDYNIEQGTQANQADLQKQLEDALYKQGVLEKFQKYYVPKK